MKINTPNVEIMLTEDLSLTHENIYQTDSEGNMTVNPFSLIEISVLLTGTRSPSVLRKNVSGDSIETFLAKTRFTNL